MRHGGGMPDLPILLVPGLGLGPEAWQPTLRAWAPASPATVVPLPGYGVRGRRTDDLRPAALAARLLDHLGGPGRVPAPVVLVGHSASCQVVAAAAAAAPDRVAGLVLVGPTTDPRAATWSRLVARWLSTARREDPRQVPALVRQYARTGLATMTRAMDAARRDLLPAHLASAHRPVLVLRGRHDQICPVTWADALTARSDRWASRTLAAGAHMVPLTHGRLVAEQAAAFVDALPR